VKPHDPRGLEERPATSIADRRKDRIELQAGVARFPAVVSRRPLGAIIGRLEFADRGPGQTTIVMPRYELEIQDVDHLVTHGSYDSPGEEWLKEGDQFEFHDLELRVVRVENTADLSFDERLICVSPALT
jgi:hypothetical protein